jgi:chaperonin GroES
MAEEAYTQDTDAEVEVIFQNKNLADKLKEDKLTKIGMECKKGFEADLQTRSSWERDIDEWTKLAKQVREMKTYPWPKASNVKYPLLSTAAMQFSARAYPSLIPASGQLVNAKVVGMDPDGQKLEKSYRVGKYMSYQIMHEMDNWEEDMDRMLMMLPVVGTMFKKTWYDKQNDTVRSCLILPKNLVVNYWTKNLESCERISEIIELSPRLLKERQNSGVFKDIDLGPAPLPSNPDPHQSQTAVDQTTPYILIEQHTFLDLDDDGYAEPYIVTFHRETGKVLRIANRYAESGIHKEGKKLIRIDPIQMYTKFGFVPNPDGGFYDIGFGVLLGPINESVNTLINILTDSGHLATLQSGFIGKGLRLKMGDAKFQPGEWKGVPVSGDDIKKNIFPLPTKDPSDVLFKLLGTLITSGKELASVAEIFTGKMPGQNTPATTTMATVEQGMKVFTAVYKRIFRSLSQEYKKVYNLNFLYLDPNKYIKVLDINIGPEDFNGDDCDIEPGADPTASTAQEKLQKAQGLVELLQLGPGILDPIKVFARILEAQEQPNWQDLFTMQVQQTGQMPPPPPDPKMIAIQAKAEADQKKLAMDLQAKQQEMELDARDSVMQMQMKQQEHAMKMEHVKEETMVKAQSELAMSQVFQAAEAGKAQQTMANDQQQHQQKMEHTKEKDKLAIQSQKAKAKSGAATKSQKSSSKK